MWRSIASTALTMAVFVLFIAAGVVIWGQDRFNEPGPLAQAVCFRVEQGSGFRSIADDLHDTGAISSVSIFNIGVDLGGQAALLKAGQHIIPANASMREIVTLLTAKGQSTCGTEIIHRIGVTAHDTIVRTTDPDTGFFDEVASFSFSPTGTPPQQYLSVLSQSETQFRLILAEGVTNATVQQALDSIDHLSGEITDLPGEGRLAPGEYLLKKNMSRQSIIDAMTRAQQDILQAAWDARVDDLPYASPDEALIMASIIEKETGVADERRLVAGVFVNRLRQGMKLQTDPTVIYGITLGQGTLGRGLRRSELRRETPYNTYVIEGLPPTPIANPGKAAIRAALNPEDTPYIFFVADGTGGHAFAADLATHNENVARYREIEAARDAQSSQ